MHAARICFQSFKMFSICSLRGLRLQNSSIAADMSTGMSARSVNPDNLWVVIEDLREVLICFR